MNGSTALAGDGTQDDDLAPFGKNEWSLVGHAQLSNIRRARSQCLRAVRSISRQALYTVTTQ